MTSSLQHREVYPSLTKSDRKLILCADQFAEMRIGCLASCVMNNIDGTTFAASDFLPRTKDGSSLCMTRDDLEPVWVWANEKLATENSRRGCGINTLRYVKSSTRSRLACLPPPEVPQSKYAKVIICGWWSITLRVKSFT